MITIRPFSNKDWSATWRIIEPVFRAGETYAYSPEITEKEARKVWITEPSVTYVAVDEKAAIVGTYYLKPIQPALGAHICNCGYIVSEQARGQGIASQMCKHSQSVALTFGFHAMQYNLVVSSNESAIRLWKRHGFSIIGTVPKAFRHRQLGFVDAHIMFKRLQN